MKRQATWYLTASLILNIFLIGAVAGRISYRTNELSPAISENVQAEKLPLEKRAMFLNTLHSAHDEMEHFHDRMTEEKKEALRLLAAEPFDATAYLTATQHMNDLHDHMRRHVAEYIAALAAKLTPGERKVLMETLAQQMSYGGGPGHPNH